MNFQRTEQENYTFIQQSNRNILKVSEHQLTTKFRSKQDIYQYLTEVLHYYLPPKEYINKDFIRQILKDEKKVLKMEQVKFIKVPRYEELSIKNLIQQVMEDESLKSFLPNFLEKNKQIPRDYFFNVLNTLYPQYMDDVIRHSQNIRARPEMNEEKKDYILISDQWFDQLMSQPFISRKPGKTIQLLKESSKVIKGRRQRMKPEVSLSLKRFKNVNGEAIQMVNNRIINDNDEKFEEYESYESDNVSNPQRKNTFNI